MNALLFPGQGAQAPGMGRDLAEAHPEARALFDRASAILGYDLAALCFNGPETELTKSDRAQPAIFVHSLAALAALGALKPGLAWSAAAGLSSGEWAALQAAGVLTFEDAVQVLQARGQYMQEACERNPGGMISVLGLEEPALEEICRESGAEIANLNSPGQTVLSGTVPAMEKATELATAKQATKVVRLNVAGAFHSSLMQPAADRLAALLADVEFRAPAFPVLSNVTGLPHGGPDEIRRAMVRQVTGAVRFYQGVYWMRDHGVRRYVECGPGKVLTGLVKRIDRDSARLTISDLASLQAGAAQL